MAKKDQGILDNEIEKTPVSLFGFETTGLSPEGGDRVVEISVLRFDPGIEPKIVFDTLVNPKRKVASTEIHGITDADLVDAPTFEEVVGDFLKAISDSVIAAYNVHFEIKFLEFELNALGISKKSPHFCLMYMNPMLGLGKKQSFEALCRHYGIGEGIRHVAGEDILASGEIYKIYREAMMERKVRTFKDLAERGDHEFLSSFQNIPYRISEALQFPGVQNLKSRYFKSISDEGFEILTVEEPDTWKRDIMTYWDALKTALDDLIIDSEELEYLESLRKELDIPTERVRVLHARAFVSVVNEYITDQWLDEEERENLRKLYQCLTALGWAPGQ